MFPLSFPQRRTCKPASYSGWALDCAVALDCAQPGFLAASFLASSSKRQAQFAVLAAYDPERPDLLAKKLRAISPDIISPGLDPTAQVARALILGRARTILNCLYGNIPVGLLGVFGRIGLEPLRRKAAYEELHAVFSDPVQRLRARALCQMEGKLHQSTLAAVLALDPILVHPIVLRKIAFGVDAGLLNGALRTIRQLCSDASEANLRESIRQIGPDQSLSTWVTRWISKADRLPLLEIADAAFKRLLPSELGQTGRRWRNCLGSHVGLAALGRVAFAEFTGTVGRCIIQLDHVDAGWVFAGAHAIGNEILDHRIAAEARARLSACGVMMPAHGPAERRDLDAVAKLVENLWGWDFHPDCHPDDAADALTQVEDAA